MELRNNTLKFLVFGDLHYDEVADRDRRIEEILANAGNRDLDFVVSLGDLCNPVRENRKVLERFKSPAFPSTASSAITRQTTVHSTKY